MSLHECPAASLRQESGGSWKTREGADEPSSRNLAVPWAAATGLVDETPRIGGGRFYDSFKAGADFLAAAVLLLLTSPIILLAACIVRWTTPGPAFYTQVRLGRRGKPYVLYKLRSMHHDCERATGACWSRKHDPRVTRFGQFMRRTHIDELPQLWNVLRGEMSMIGPRPERPEIIADLETAIPRYRDRLLVKPGLAGLAQIQLPPDTDLESTARKLELDRLYVQRRGLLLDLKICAGTILYLFGVRYTTLGRWLRLPSRRQLEEPALPIRTVSAPRRSHRHAWAKSMTILE